MSRAPQDIFTAHAEAIAAGDLDALAADYAEDAVLLTTDGARSGPAEIREFLAGALATLADAELSVGSLVVTDDALLITWSATTPRGRITDAVDTFVFADDRIRLQTTVFALEPSPP